MISTYFLEYNLFMRYSFENFVTSANLAFEIQTNSWQAKDQFMSCELILKYNAFPL